MLLSTSSCLELRQLQTKLKLLWPDLKGNKGRRQRHPMILVVNLKLNGHPRLLLQRQHPSQLREFHKSSQTQLPPPLCPHRRQPQRANASASGDWELRHANPMVPAQVAMVKMACKLRFLTCKRWGSYEHACIISYAF